MHVRDECGEVVNNVACVQYAYVYDKEEVKFAMKPHKSSKNGKGVPYTRTKSSRDQASFWNCNRMKLCNRKFPSAAQLKIILYDDFQDDGEF